MLVAEYHDFVQQADQSADKPDPIRRDIALYGVVGELGSLVSAVKKQMLSEDGIVNWSTPNQEIVEELGDALWYTFQVSHLENGASFDLLKNGIKLLGEEIGADNERAQQIRAALDLRDPTRKNAFLQVAATFDAIEPLSLDQYQEVAFLTARTDGKVLLEVCLALVSQLGAELLRTKKLPEIEITLNKAMADRPINTVLSEITWHLAAIATLFGLKVSKVVEVNRKKVSFRLNRGQPTPLHDIDNEAHEQIPRRMEIAFVTVGKGRSRMYLNGRQLGDELTDNAYDDDGYRFHDVLHLANAAKLGWSPVLRSLLAKKRKSKRATDEVEDGARAKIVEEAIVKSIHTEGVKIARNRQPNRRPGPEQLFPKQGDVTFRFLKFVNEFVLGLEAAKNRFWEWEDAIHAGCEVFYQLSQEEQGTVVVDLNIRQLTFRPEVHIEIKGTVAGLGGSLVSIELLRAQFAEEGPDPGFLTKQEIQKYWSGQGSLEEIARVLAVKKAVLTSIEMSPEDEALLQLIEVTLMKGSRVSIKAQRDVQEEMWRRSVITFKTTLTEVPGVVSCTALAISDARDSIRRE